MPQGIPGRFWPHNVERSLVYVLGTIALSSSRHHETARFLVERAMFPYPYPNEDQIWS